MNKLTQIAATTVLTLTLLAPGLAAANETKAMVDYSNVKVVTMGKVERVPLREIAEKLAYEVNWDAKTHFIVLTCTKMGASKMMGTKYTVKIKIGSNKVTVDMAEKMLSNVPIIMNSKTYVTKEFIEMYLVNQTMMK